jgi:hypothetical protein
MSAVYEEFIKLLLRLLQIAQIASTVVGVILIVSLVICIPFATYRLITIILDKLDI